MVKFEAKFSDKWWKEFDKLSAENQRKISACVTKLLKDPTLKSLRVKKIQSQKEKPPIMEATANMGEMGLHISFQYYSNKKIFFSHMR